MRSKLKLFVSFLKCIQKIKAVNKATADYLLSGKIFCGCCVGDIRGNRRKQIYYYYDCSNKKRLKNCTSKAVRKDILEADILRKIRALLKSNEIDNVADKLYQSMQGINDNISPLRKTLKIELRKVETKIDNINNAIAEGVYSSSTMSKLKELEEQQGKLFIKLADLSKKKVETTKSLSEIKSVLKYALTHSDSDLMLINIFVEKVVCFENNEYEVILNP